MVDNIKIEYGQLWESKINNAGRIIIGFDGEFVIFTYDDNVNKLRSFDLYRETLFVMHMDKFLETFKIKDKTLL